jgi:hypothetical protein
VNKKKCEKILSNSDNPGKNLLSNRAFSSCVKFEIKLFCNAVEPHQIFCSELPIKIGVASVLGTSFGSGPTEVGFGYANFSFTSLG